VACIALAAGIVPFTATAQHTDDNGTWPATERDGCYLLQAIENAFPHFDLYWNESTVSASHPAEERFDGCAANCQSLLDPYTGAVLYPSPPYPAYDGAFEDYDYDGDGNPDGDVSRVGRFLECVWTTLIGPGHEGEEWLFQDMLGSALPPHLDNQPDQIPLWIRGCGGGGSAGPAPMLNISPYDGVFPYPDPGDIGPAPDYDSNAFHEFGHIIVWSYNRYLGRAGVPLVNEGLATYLEVPVSPCYDPLSNPCVRDGAFVTDPVDTSMVERMEELPDRGPVKSLPTSFTIRSRSRSRSCSRQPL
jgi:hypothetical protein